MTRNAIAISAADRFVDVVPLNGEHKELTITNRDDHYVRTY